MRTLKPTARPPARRTANSATGLAAAALALMAAGPLSVAVAADDVPAGATWYFHADLDEMRSSEAGAALYAWIEAEVFDEVRKESGIDLGKEVNRVTAWSLGEEDGAMMVIDGSFSQATRDKALVAAAAAERFETLQSGRDTYYYVRGDGSHETPGVQIDGVDNEFYFSFAVDDKLLVAARKPQMEALLENRGRIAGSRSHEGALFLLTAEQSLIQAGMDTSGIDDGDDGFRSNILRNTRQVALLVADVAGMIAVDVQLLATEAATAESMASIVRGLIALQAFSGEVDPAVTEVLQGTRVEVDDTRLKISVALSSAFIEAALDEA
ncbi:MAG TPA: hypothetical protein VFY03_13490 [Woeseiaceae bacterium]|nr:hypothetical protein [Woeseiaceae bacterium]